MRFSQPRCVSWFPDVAFATVDHDDTDRGRGFISCRQKEIPSANQSTALSRAFTIAHCAGDSYNFTPTMLSEPMRDSVPCADKT